MQSVIDAANGVRVGQPVVHRNLTVFPLFGGDAAAAGYLTLDEALAQRSDG